MPVLQLFWMGSVFPGFLAGSFAKYFPEFRAWWHAFTIPMRHGMQEKEQKDHMWEADWVQAYGSRGPSHRDYRSRGRQRAHGQYSGSKNDHKGSSNTAAPGDASGYYRILGVPPSASISEIQAAFRAAALKYHPDQAGAGDKKLQTERFQRIVEAYGNLRDPVKRHLYDNKA